MMNTPLHIVQQIDANRVARDPVLDLSRQCLLHVPPEIKTLDHLQEINLRNNAIQTLPDWLNDLPTLQFIHLNINPLHDLGKVRNLVLDWGVWLRLEPDPAQIAGLWLRWEEDAAIWAKLKHLPDLRRLDLSEQRLRELPVEICQLQHLTQLNLSHNGLSTLPPEIAQLQRLTKLSLRNNLFSTLPPEITQLQHLTQLSLRNNGLSMLPPEIIQLQHLTQLDLRNNELSMLPAKFAQLYNLTQLDLGNNLLRTLLPEIIQLKNLTQLDLGYNSISKLPSEIVQLSNLMELFIGGNDKLSTLPSEITQLQNLTQLNLESNELSTLPPEIAQLQHLSQLNLSHNKLSTLPLEIVQLQHLSRLNLSYNKLSTLPTEIARLQNLTWLNLESNRLKLPFEITQLQDLTQLNLGNNQLNPLPLEICQLHKLLQLGLANNGLSKLPPEITQLQHLTQLDLSRNGFNTLPPEIAQLQHLTQLDLNRNRFSTLPPEFAQLQHLAKLNLASNGFSKLPPEITQLQHLTQLNLKNNGFSTLPSEIAQLRNLAQLDLGYNKFSLLPSEIIQLQNLTQLNLSYNGISILPANICQLQHLSKLDLGGESLSSIGLDIKNALISTLPIKITQLLNLRVLGLNNNPVETPPLESLDLQAYNGELGYVEDAADITALRNFFRLLTEEDTDYLYEAKLLIVGEGGAGKTSLARRIRDQHAGLSKQSDTTRGIEIVPWTFPREDGNEFRVNIWDFGGQQIYHATHQFFLTKRSLYVLVVEPRKEEANFYDWLNRVELFGDDSPVFIVKNHRDGRVVELDEPSLKARFKHLEKSFDWDLSTNDGYQAVMDFLRYQVQALPHVGQQLPKSWLEIRAVLEADERDTISQDDYFDICETHGFTREYDKLQLSRYLHDLGVFLHFQDDDLLSRMVILKPTWATDAVYKVLDDPTVQQRRGRFFKTDLQTIWADAQYAKVRPELLQLMQNFYLCYDLPGGEEYIIPQLLGKEKPHYDWDDRHNLQLRYDYPRFMPSGILTRLIVAIHPMIEANRERVWRHGVVVNDGHARAEIRENIERRELRLRLSGERQRDLLTKLIYELGKIHHSQHDLEYEMLVPCHCQLCNTLPEPHFYRYDNLKRREAAGKPVNCDKSMEDVDAKSLLDNIIIPDKERGNAPQYHVEGDLIIQHQDNRDHSVHAENSTVGAVATGNGATTEIETQQIQKHQEDDVPDASMTPAQRQAQLNQQLNLLYEKQHELRQARIIETDAAEKFKLKQQIAEVDAEIERVEELLDGVG